MQSGLTPNPISASLSAHDRFNAERLRRVDFQALRQFSDRFLPLGDCEQFGVVPLGQGGQFCTLGVCNPKMVGLWSCVDRLEQEGFIVRIERVSPALHQQVLQRLRNPNPLPLQEEERGTGGATGPVIGTSIISSDSLMALTRELQAETSANPEELVNENAPVVRLLRNLIGEAIQRGVSDVHIEPQADSLRIRLRKDGILHTVASLPPASLGPLIARVKVMSRLNITERRLPQDGALRFDLSGQSYDIRVSTLPGRFGEKAVLRILGSSQISLDMDDLITAQAERDRLREASRRAYGIIVVSGPTGSGKTTTLYSLLRERNDPRINILTVEDPVEYTLPGIHQVQIIREKGYDFARALRAFMRQDPDVILVGETRDPETAKTAVEASLTGHLVFTTLHANDALTSIPRLTEMGVEPYLMASSLLAICAQRLVRQVCPTCSRPHTYPAQQMQLLGLDGDRTFQRAAELKGKQLQQATLEGTLCGTCNGLGYVGRVGVYEVVVVDDALRAMIAANASMEAMERHVRQVQGSRSLMDYAIHLLEEGLTTVEEVQRVCLSM